MKRRTLRSLFLAVAGALALGPGALAQTFHKYVALGDSLTAAVEGGCIVARHQNHSYPKVIADQIGITDFQQPIVNEKALSSPLTGTACLGPIVSGTSISAGPVSQMGAPANLTLARPYDNLGIAGANTADLVDLKTANPTGNTANQNAALVLRNFPGGPFAGKSAVDEANLLNPDFVTVWIGNNDVLGAALSGVAVDNVTLTSVSTFTTKYTAVITGLKASGRTIAVLNIPDVTAIPFTTTIPPVVVNPATRQPVLIGGNTVPLLGSRTTTGCSTAPCPIPSGTLVTLGASALLSQGIGIPTALGGTGVGLPDGSVGATGLSQGVLLYPDEVAAIRTRTAELNGVIASVASANGAILVDINSIFNDIKANGYTIGGVTVDARFLQGGLFSADGFHASNIGYAVVADEIIKAVNAAKSTDIPEPNLASALFTADVPVTGAASRTGGPFGYPAEAAFGLLQMFPPVDADTQIVAPEPEGDRSPRVVRSRN
jgi:lysophospholipase L1-like esterase